MMTQLGKSIENLSTKADQKCSAVMEKLPKEQDTKEKSSSEPRNSIGTLSDLGFVQLASVKFRGKEKRKYSSDKKLKKKKDLIKDWQQSYDEMCDRAQKLDLAIKMAEIEEMEIRPVNQFNADLEKNEKWRHKMIAGGSFYSLQSADSSDTHVLEDILILDQCLTDKFSSLDYLPSIKSTKPKPFQKRSVSFHGFKKMD